MDITRLFAGVKLRAEKEVIIFSPYDEIERKGENEYEGRLLIKNKMGEFCFRDRILASNTSFSVQVNCVVNKLSSEIVGVGIFCGIHIPFEYKDLEFFSPSAWYGKGSVFEGKSNKFPMNNGVAGGGIDGIGAPICSAYCKKDNCGYSIEVINPKYDIVISRDDVIIDERIKLSSLGVKRGENNSLFYSYPATSYNINGTNRSIEYYLPITTKEIRGEYEIHKCTANSFHQFMKDNWRQVYYKYAKLNDDIDTDLARKHIVEYVARSYGKINGISEYLVNSDHFTHESGFLYRNTDLGYLMVRYGYETNNQRIIDEAISVIDDQVDSCFAGEKQVFPFERSRFEGVLSILNAYEFLKSVGIDKENWISFVEKEADRFEGVDEYYSIPLLCRLNRLLSAIEKGEKVWERFSMMKFSGGIEDFIGSPGLDKESGYLGLFAFLSLYECTKDEKWLARSAFCGDYLETYQVLIEEGFYSYETSGNEHFNMASIGNEKLKTNGLSYVSAGCCAGDLMNVISVPLYIKLSEYTKDKHYLDYAMLVERNGLNTIDLFNKGGSLSDVLLNSGIGYMSEYFQLSESIDPNCTHRGCAHDATIAWMYFVLLHSQQEVQDMLGRPYINPNKLEQMEINISPLCSFICSNKDVSNLYSLDFYKRTRFDADEKLTINLFSPSNRIVLSHSEKYVEYIYDLSFVNKNDEVILVNKVDKVGRFVSIEIPKETKKIIIDFHTDVDLRQIQIFGMTSVSNIDYLINYQEKIREDKEYFSSGSAYSSINKEGSLWDYLYKENGKYYPLRYDDIKNAYGHKGEEHLLIKTGNLVHPGKYLSAVRSFSIPFDGLYTVISEITPAPYLSTYGGEVISRIYLNDKEIDDRRISIQRESLERVSFKKEMKKGDKIYFEICPSEKGNNNCFVCNEIIVRREE